MHAVAVTLTPEVRLEMTTELIRCFGTSIEVRREGFVIIYLLLMLPH
jgi:hypothetical protein